MTAIAMGPYLEQLEAEARTGGSLVLDYGRRWLLYPYVSTKFAVILQRCAQHESIVFSRREALELIDSARDWIVRNIAAKLTS